MHALVGVTAVIQFTFVPIVTIGDWNVRLQTIALAVVVFLALVIAAVIARSTPVDLARDPDGPGPSPGEPNHLRADDLLYIAVAALPGAVLFGRLGYGLLHLDYYQANPSALLDVTQGSFELATAVVGGTLSAMIVAGLLGAPIGRWMHAAIVPLLFAIAGGKAAMILGGDGQGTPWDGSLATAYLGPGPWGSLAPALPSHPSQAYEAVATLVVLLIVGVLMTMGAFQRRGAGAFLLGIGLWAIARAIVASTWRDPAVVGPLNMGQVISIVIAVGALVSLVVVAARARRGESPQTPVPAGEAPLGPAPTPQPGPATGTRTGNGMDWPDPTERPRI